MSTYNINDKVGDIVIDNPALSRVFEKEGVDFCCGGQQSIEEACQKQGLDSEALLRALEAGVTADETDVDVSGLSQTELVDHIEQTHHQYMRNELPRLDAYTAKVASVHGDKNRNLLKIRTAFMAMSTELMNHLMKEEQVLFPMVKDLDKSETAPTFHCGLISNPINQMVYEHIEVGTELEQLRELTDDYTAPEWACNTYRAMLDGLEEMELDLHQHIHKENNILFPRALAMETEKGH